MFLYNYVEKAVGGSCPPLQGLGFMLGSGIFVLLEQNI